jgi:hypothetical protein
MKNLNIYRNPFAFFALNFAPFAVKKKSLIKLGIMLLCFFISSGSFSQELKLSEVIINIAEELSDDDSNPDAASSYIERLQELAENPVKLNSSGENELSRLFFLSDFQVKALADYAHSSGKIVTVFELANIPGFDRETVEMMIPFITLDTNFKTSVDSAHGKSTLLTNLYFKPGNIDTSYLGPPWKILTKYKFTAGGFSAGFTVEKDPGEKFFSGNLPLPDFLSANIAYSGNGLIRRIVIGDYSARFGQGSNINTSIRAGLSLTAPGYMSGSNEIRPYTSTDENNFFRGVAAEISIKDLGVSVFYSDKNSDATLGSSSGSSKNFIESFYTSGIHNTSSLLLKKDAVSEETYGLNLSYSFKNLRAGLTWSENRFSLPVHPVAGVPENVFGFDGDRNSLYTFYYNSFIRKILIYGEFSAAGNRKYALIQGMSLRPSDRLIIGFLFWHYDAGFTSFHGNGTASTSSSGNSHGILGNFTFEAARHLFISGGVDIRNFPWLKYRNSSPSEGSKQEIRVKFMPSEKMTIESSYSYRFSMADNNISTGVPEPEKMITRSLKGLVKYSVSDKLMLITRMEYKIANPSESRGSGLVQDLNYNFRKIPLTIWLRSCVFYTGSWESRIYFYENDLLYSYSIPAYSEEGSRSYIMTKWEIGRFAEVRVRYAVTSLITKNDTNSAERRDFRIQFKAMF